MEPDLAGQGAVHAAGHARRRRGGLAVFESWRGQYNDSPRAISEHLAREAPEIGQIWVVADRSIELPPGTRRVVRNTAAYFAQLVRANWVVTNDAMPRYPGRTRRNRVVQTWHGTPLKKIGFDVAEMGARYDGYLDALRRDVARWSHLVSPSPYCTRIFRQAFRYDGVIVETGYPRNDVLVGPSAGADRERMRRTLGISDDTTAILYAPTWREESTGADGRPVMSQTDELLALAAALPDDAVVLARMHRVVASRLHGLHERVLDVSDHPEIADLYLAADALVTDYSSVMFDFAVTGKPMAFLTTDLQRYRDVVRGFYFDLEARAPGPVLDDPVEVARALADLPRLGDDYAERYRSFAEEFVPLDDGHAARRACDAIFGTG